jgi:hypothetical protein
MRLVTNFASALVALSLGFGVAAGSAAAPGVLPAGSIGPKSVVAGRTIDRLPMAAILPSTARLDQRWRIPASGREPSQMLVLWHARVLDAPKGGALYPETLYRLILWTPTRQLSASRWRWTAFGVMVTNAPVGNEEQVTLADLTGDGHPEVLSHYIWGNHNGGPFSVVATVAARPRCVLCSSKWFETYWHVHAGTLHVDVPDFQGNDSLCCPSGVFHLTYGWNGARLVVTNRSRTAYHS